MIDWDEYEARSKIYQELSNFVAEYHVYSFSKLIEYVRENKPLEYHKALYINARYFVKLCERERYKMRKR